MAATMLYITENKRKTLAGLLAGLLVLAIGFVLGQLAAPAPPPDVTPQLAAARHQLVREHATSVTAGGVLANARRTIARLRATMTRQRSTIARQQKRIRTLRHSRHARVVHHRKRRR